VSGFGLALVAPGDTLASIGTSNG